MITNTKNIMKIFEKIDCDGNGTHFNNTEDKEGGREKALNQLPVVAKANIKHQ